MSSNEGWIGVDLDATLAHYDGWKGVEHIGAPVPAMVERVKGWLAEGKAVRIFTARVCVNELRDAAESRLAELAIQAWCVTHIGQALPVTNVKDFGMIALYDDRAVQVVANEGREIVDAGVPCPLCDAETVCRASQGERKWLHCFTCKADFAPEQATFQAGFRRGLAEGHPTKQQQVCQHGSRIAYEPTSSTGDESDYESRCLDCKKLLRMAPNV